jgi:transposase
VLLAARRSAVQAVTEAQLQVFNLVIAAPEPIRARFPGQKLPSMLATAANLRLCSSWDVETTTTTTVIALRSLARRFRALSIEAKERDKAIRAIVRAWRPDLLEEFDAGAILAATVLCAGPPRTDPLRGRVRDARRRGAHPRQQRQVTNRYRLNRYGDRQLNRALHTVVQSRIRYDRSTRDYVARRTTEGKTGREIKRCLSRYIARDLYRLLESGPITA